MQISYDLVAFSVQVDQDQDHKHMSENAVSAIPVQLPGTLFSLTDTMLLTSVHSENDYRVYFLIVLTIDYCTALLDILYNCAIQNHIELKLYFDSQFWISCSNCYSFLVPCVKCCVQHGSVYTWHGIRDNCQEADWETQGTVIGLCWYGRHWVDQCCTHLYRKGIVLNLFVFTHMIVAMIDVLNFFWFSNIWQCLKC